MNFDEPVVIGIGGRKTVGKDTFAHLLPLVVDNRPWDFVQMSDPLWTALKTLDPLVTDDGQHLSDVLATDMEPYSIPGEENYVAAKKLPEVRRLLQTLGTNVVRDMVDQDAWVKMAASTIQSKLDAGHHVALTGVRFPNELAMVEGFDRCLTVWISRELEQDEQSNHASEVSLTEDDFGYTVWNNGTIDDLRQTVEALVYTFKGLGEGE